MLPQQTDVAVMGAGISGLSLSYFLQKSGRHVALIESATRVGGCIQSQTNQDCIIEAGPNGIFAAADAPIHQLIEALGLAPQRLCANPNQRYRYIYHDGQLQPLPLGPLSFMRTPLLSAQAKLRLLREPFIPAYQDSREESLAHFVRRRLGNEVLQNFVDPLVTGIYAGDPERLSARSAFPKMVELELKDSSLLRGLFKKMLRGQKSQRPQLTTLKNGLSTLTAALAKSLTTSLHLQCQLETLNATPQGWQLQLQQAGTRTQLQCRHLVIATGAPAAAQITSHFSPDLAALIRQVVCLPLISQSLLFKRADLGSLRPGYGFLVPRQAQLNLLGSIWVSSIFAQRCADDAVLLTCMLGGARQPQLIEQTQDELLQLTLKDLRSTMGISAKPCLVQTHFWRQTIPQYELGHAALIEQVLAAKPANLDFTGNYIDGISVSHCVARAQTLATQLSKE